VWFLGKNAASETQIVNVKVVTTQWRSRGLAGLAVSLVWFVLKNAASETELLV